MALPQFSLSPRVPRAFFIFSFTSNAEFLHLFLSLLFPLPLTLKRFSLTHIPTHLFGRAVPGAMWQPRRLLGGPLPVRGGLDWRCVRPESMPSALWRTRPVPRRDLHLPARLGGRALQHWWALRLCLPAWGCLIIPCDILISVFNKIKKSCQCSRDNLVAFLLPSSHISPSVTHDLDVVVKGDLSLFMIWICIVLFQHAVKCQ